MRGAIHAAARSAMGLLLLAVVALLCAVALLAPQSAWAAEGDIVGYAYLDPDENGDNTALVVQDVKRTEVEIERTRCIDLGPWLDSRYDLPWDSWRETIRSARFIDKGGGICPELDETGLFCGCSMLNQLDLGGLDVSGMRTMIGLSRYRP